MGTGTSCDKEAEVCDEGMAEGEESEDADASDASDARAIAIAVEMRCATTHPTIFSREGFAPGAARRKR